MPDDSRYLWEVDGSPATVELRFSLISQLNQHPPGEARGPLFGRWKDGRTIELSDCEASPGLSQVGYFRIREVPGPALDTDDRSNVARRFSGQPAVVLAIRRTMSGHARAAFFFWDGKSIDGRFSTLPFPFDRELLLSEGHPVRHTEAVVSDETARELPRPATRVPWFHLSWTRMTTKAAPFAAAALIVILGVFASRHVQRTDPPLAVKAAAVPVREPLPPPAGSPVSPPASQPQAELQPEPQKRSPFRAASGLGRKARILPPSRETANAATGSTSSSPLISPPEPAPDLPVEATPPPAAAAPVPARQLAAEIYLQPVHPSFLNKALRHVPILSRLSRDRETGNFVPARPIRRTQIDVPAELSRHIEHDVPVDLRIRITKSGEVEQSELVSRDANPALSMLAIRAAAQWNFEPARVRDKPVASEMLVHFRFRPAAE